MGTSPVSILVIIGIYVSFFALIETPGADEPTIDPDSSGVQNQSFGGLDILGDIIDAVVGVIQFIFDALTFNVRGAPAYIRAPVAIAINGSLIWSIITLIRGN